MPDVTLKHTPEVPVVGGTAALQRAVRGVLNSYPAWLLRAARLSRVTISSSPEVRAQVAVYNHGSREMDVSADVGGLMRKAVGHELAHAIDDNFGHPHHFTSTPEWRRIHREQPFFDLPKYRDEPLEYFADMMVKFLMMGGAKLRHTNPKELAFITSWVVPSLLAEFGGM